VTYSQRTICSDITLPCA